MVELPGWHGSPLNHWIEQQIARLARGDLPGRRTTVAYQVMRGVGSAWQVPALPLSLVHAWHAADVPDTAFGQNGCRYRTRGKDAFRRSGEVA